MVTRYRVAIDGNQLDDISEKIIITDINEQTPSVGVSTMTNAGRDGNRVLRQYRQNLQVTVSFAVQDYDIKSRKETISNIQRWAMNGGKLTVNDRKGQFLRVICTQLPTVTSSQRWLETLSVVFTAYAVPYWQAEEFERINLSVTKANVKSSTLFKASGTADKAYVNVYVKNNDDKAMTSLTIRTGDTYIYLTGMNVKKGKNVVIEYDENNIITIKQKSKFFEDREGDKSLLINRLPKSDDDLFTTVGVKRTFSVTADAKCDAYLYVRGLYL